MTHHRADLERQLRRQSIWLMESWQWILRSKVIGSSQKRLSALEVGCGPGFVMDALSGLMDIKGLDIDQDMVSACVIRGLDVVQGQAERLPFDDATFDVVYCSFLMLWVDDPLKVLREMKRVSKGHVLCLAEPDFGARIDYPDELRDLEGLVVEGMTRAGGDPFIGRKLRALFEQLGLPAEIGVHPGTWDLDQLKTESEDEWKWIEMSIAPQVEDERWRGLRSAWDRALNERTLFQYNPIFFAIARKS